MDVRGTGRLITTEGRSHCYGPSCYRTLTHSHLPTERCSRATVKSDYGEIWCPLSVSPKALTQRTGAQTPFPGCLKSLLQLRSLGAGNPESRLPPRVGSSPTHACVSRPGGDGLSGGNTLITHHPQLPGVPLHNPAARGKRAGREKLCTHRQHVERREFAALSDAIAGLNTPRKNALGFNSHQAPEAIIPKY